MTLSFTQVKELYPTAISGTAVSSMNLFLFLGASVFTTITDLIIGSSLTVENFTLVWILMLSISILAFILVYASIERREGEGFIGVSTN